MRVRRAVLADLIVLLFLAGFGVPSASASAPGQPPLGRWFGAEGGWTETACYGFASGCSGFLGIGTLGGQVGARETHKPFQDVDMVQREWPARTGNYLFLATVPGGTPSTALLSTVGSDSGPVRAGTVAFAFRVHNLPLQPVVIYRHLGTVPSETPLVTVSLTPDGRLVLSAAGLMIGASQPVGTMQWHALAVTYRNESNSPLKLYVDDQEPVVGSLMLPGPSGDLELGVVSPTSTPFNIGLDDFVDSPVFDAPIHGARINYLMPLGETAAGWTKGYPVPACRDAAKNWQLVSEDQWVTGTDSDGKQVSCSLGGSAVTTNQNGVVDQYLTEGIPSKHSPTTLYKRDLSAQPKAGAAVLGVRLRARGLTDGPPVPVSLGYLDGVALTQDNLTFDNGGTGGSQMNWGPTHPARPGGGLWTAAALNALQLRLDSGPGLPGLAVGRLVFAVRLDYVWVP